jgi:hypothetical protein
VSATWPLFQRRPPSINLREGRSRDKAKQQPAASTHVPSCPLRSTHSPPCFVPTPRLGRPVPGRCANHVTLYPSHARTRLAGRLPCSAAYDAQVERAVPAARAGGPVTDAVPSRLRQQPVVSVLAHLAICPPRCNSLHPDRQPGYAQTVDCRALARMPLSRKAEMGSWSLAETKSLDSCKLSSEAMARDADASAVTDKHPHF